MSIENKELAYTNFLLSKLAYAVYVKAKSSPRIEKEYLKKIRAEFEIDWGHKEELINKSKTVKKKGK